ncbi:site-specific DNA-methyltransferase (adenine-specific) [Sphingomonas laterariae]|uniref:Methyltransferase n=1 Tax=Edaphosphingomonas laterariae TaxID=861865 RepID=A0A239CM13_9SPHN|nr:DNA methyltransferase [Sphingomonas laterariae]SNS21177.1 site-specific DNA-methyltransferase (adenine-specific) [Sphingomonas laterariae]
MVTSPVQIGPATLYCGDAYQIRPSLGFFDADVMDPPYLFDNSGGGTFRKSRVGADRIVAEGLDQGFDRTIINPLLCGAVAVFCHNDQLPELLPYLDGVFHRFALLMWTKPNPMPMRNRHYLPDTEPFIHAWNRGYHPIGEHHDMHRWIHANSMPTKLFDHPTVKPMAVMEKILRNVSGEAICDPFMGTGSTGVAAIRAGKRFTGIEKNPAHFATAVERLRTAWEQINDRAQAPKIEATA